MIYDICVIGLGLAGSFATHRISQEYPDAKCIAIDFGRPPMKRRQQMGGWLGLLPFSDGKWWMNDIKSVAAITTSSKANKASKIVNATLKNISSCQIVKDKGPNTSLKNKIKQMGFQLEMNNYIQFYPSQIHSLSKYMSETIDKSNNIQFSFDNAMQSIIKQKNIFIIQTEQQEIKARKVILCLGRGGWRETHDVFKKFDLIEKNDTARFGLRLEMPAHFLKDFNHSPCSLLRKDLTVGPFSWFGTVIPEDHGEELVISSFRSNENRWETDKVSFQFIANIHYPKEGFEQVDKIGKLTFILSNERVIKQKVSSIMNKKNEVLSIIPQYNWLSTYLKEFSQLVPEVLTKAYFHIPTLMPLAGGINLSNNLETEIDGLFVAGESAGVQGLYSAAMMGIIAADAACK